MALSTLAHSGGGAYKWEDGHLFLRGEPVTIVFFEGREDEPWFKAKPVHNFLGCTTIVQTLARVDTEDKASLKDLVQRLGRPTRVGAPPPDHEDYHEGKAIYVNESGLYALIMGSKKPESKPFQRWVTSEVLPAIRRTGRYEAPEASVAPEISAIPTPGARPGGQAHETSSPTTKRRRLADADAQGSHSCIAFKDILRKHANAPDVRSAQYVTVLRRAARLFFRMVVCKHSGQSEKTLRMRYAYTESGKKIVVPENEVHLATAAVQNALSETLHGGSDAWVPGAASSSSPPSIAAAASRPRSSSSSGFSVHTPEHSRAKDIANELWISLLTQQAPRCQGDVFYLDDFQQASGGHTLRTTEALMRSGFDVDRLHSANTNIAVVQALYRKGLRNAFHGTWADAPWGNKAFVGIYLDLCTGSAGYATEQLEVACARSAPDCVLAYTLVERNYEGEDLLMRHNRLVDLLLSRGWRPACRESFSASTLMHRSGGGGQRIVTQVWAKRAM